jgi:hypothetical protein
MYAIATPSRIKTARQLGLRVSYYKGLWKVLKLLENGELKFCPESQMPKGKRFNMTTWYDERNCGSVGCIGGWAAYFSGRRWPVSGDLYESDMVLTHANDKQDEQFNRLLYPDDDNLDWTEITPAHAARTLRGYLETGITNW